jgi:hypothetical protein
VFNGVDVEKIPYEFKMATGDFMVSGGKLKDLCFSENSMVMKTLELRNLPNLVNPKKLPSYAGSLKISDCDKLTTLNLNGIGKLLEIKNCPSLKSISIFPRIEELILSGTAMRLLPDFEHPDKILKIWIYDPQLDFSKTQEGLGVIMLSLGEIKNKSLQNIHKICPSLESLNVNSDTIKSHALCVLKLKDLNEITVSWNPSTEKWARIINKHLKNGRNIFDCQSDLIDAGLDEYAKL